MILLGFLFVGLCILCVPVMIHRNALKRMKMVAYLLADILEELIDTIKEDITDEEDRQEIVNNIIKNHMDDKK